MIGNVKGAGTSQFFQVLSWVVLGLGLVLFVISIVWYGESKNDTYLIYGVSLLAISAVLFLIFDRIARKCVDFCFRDLNSPDSLRNDEDER